MLNFSNQSFWVNIDKPASCSSAKIVSIVKKITKAKKVGHAGTLDPEATGVLPIAINEATKTCQYIQNCKKTYSFKIIWGEFRDTDDAEGRVIDSSSKRPSNIKIINHLPKFIGSINQVPPCFSAIKVGGKKAYELARSGKKDFSLNPRNINIEKIRLVNNNREFGEFIISCSKGTYIRSFARDLASSLGVCGYVSSLRRLSVGNFSVKNIISLDKLKSVINYGEPFNLLLQLRDVLSFIPEVELNDFLTLKIKTGQNISFSQKFLELKNSSVVKVINNDFLVGLASYSNESLKPIKNFNLN